MHKQTTSIVPWPYILRAGHGDSPAKGACAMDAVNWLAHGKHGDKPACACPLIGNYVIIGNDSMQDHVRQRLLPYLHRIADSRSVWHEEARARVLWLGAIRILLPIAVEGLGMPKRAEMLRAIPDDISSEQAKLKIDRLIDDFAIKGYSYDSAIQKALFYTAKAIKNASCDNAIWRSERACVAAWVATEAAIVHATKAWNGYFEVLDAVLNAGPQGQPWSADVIDTADLSYKQAGGLCVRSAS